MSIVQGKPGLVVSDTPLNGFILDLLSIPSIGAWWTTCLSNFALTVTGSPYGARNGVDPDNAISFTSNGLLDLNLLTTYANGNTCQVAFDFDQSGNGRDLLTPGTGPLVFAAPSLVIKEGTIPTTLYQGFALTPQILNRADALGLAGDPDITIAWVSRQLVLPSFGSVPVLFTLGSTVAPEIVVLQTNAGGNDFISIVDSTLTFGGLYNCGNINSNNSYILVKPAGTGYNAALWQFYINGVLTAPLFSGPAVMNIVNQSFSISDFTSVPFTTPLRGPNPGVMVFNAIPTNNDLQLLNLFLDSQRGTRHFLLDDITVQPIAAWWTSCLKSSLLTSDCYLANNGVDPTTGIPFAATDGHLNLPALNNYANGNVTVIDSFIDQSNNFNITRNSNGPLVENPPNINFEGYETPVAEFRTASPDTLVRSDALSITGDPALTIAWVMRLIPPYNSPLKPTLLSMGTLGNSELNLSFTSDGATVDSIFITNFANTAQVGWNFPLGFLSSNHSFIVKKPLANSGYDGSWTIEIDGGTPIASTQTIAGALSLGNTSFIMGDFDGSGFPFIGTIPGVMIFTSNVLGSNLDKLRIFLANQLL